MSNKHFENFDWVISTVNEQELLFKVVPNGSFQGYEFNWCVFQNTINHCWNHSLLEKWFPRPDDLCLFKISINSFEISLFKDFNKPYLIVEPFINELQKKYMGK